MARNLSPGDDASARGGPRRLRRVPVREPPPSMGERLRQARRARAVGLDDVARATHVPVKYLAALEDDEYAVLPGGVYSRGVLRTYADYLDLDAAPLLDELRPGYPRDERSAARPAGLLAAPGPTLSWSLLAGVLAVVGATLLAGYLHGQYVALSDSLAAPPRLTARGPLDLPEPLLAPWTPLPRTSGTPVPVAAMAPPDEPATVEAHADLAEPTTAGGPSAPGAATGPGGPPASAQLASAGPSAAPPAPVTVEAHLLERSWLQVWSDGRQVFADTVPAGQTRTYTANDMLQMRVGNAGGVQVLVNGEPQGRLGASGQALDVTWGRR